MLNQTKIQTSTESYRVAVTDWVPGDDIARMLGYELELLHHTPVYFYHDYPIPDEVDILLTFGPYNKILPVWRQAAEREAHRRPVVVHWNTEGLPDLRLPMPVMHAVGTLRSLVGRMEQSNSKLSRGLYSFPLVSWIDHILFRYRYLGDYGYAYHKGWLHVLADTSTIYGELRTKTGLPTLYAPWGASRYWYNDLGLERDIDVLWMGKRGTFRRSRILDMVFDELKHHGIKIHIADNEENPFIFGAERIDYLNRSKITLNITRTWYDDNFSRFTLAAPNRSLIVSEPVLPHCQEYKENVHYVSARIKDLAKTIVYYLEHEAERQEIVKNAYTLATTELLFCRSLQKMLDAAIKYRVTINR